MSIAVLQTKVNQIVAMHPVNTSENEKFLLQYISRLRTAMRNIDDLAKDYLPEDEPIEDEYSDPSL